MGRLVSAVEDIKRESAAAGPCPRCGAVLPSVVVQGDEHVELGGVDHLVVFTGCLVPLHPGPYVCRSCGTWYGDPRSQFDAGEGVLSDP